MFDIGFWELAIIGVVALFVIGPERMPEMVQTIGQWVGQIQRLIVNLKREIELETRSEEYKILNKEFLDEDRKLKAMAKEVNLDERNPSDQIESKSESQGDKKESQGSLS
tara:strand:+ start:425 stop:754 length:330 start_codon:yes stop_codon:yes gene_type:complete